MTYKIFINKHDPYETIINKFRAINKIAESVSLPNFESNYFLNQPIHVIKEALAMMPSNVKSLSLSLHRNKTVSEQAAFFPKSTQIKYDRNDLPEQCHAALLKY